MSVFTRLSSRIKQFRLKQWLLIAAIIVTALVALLGLRWYRQINRELANTAAEQNAARRVEVLVTAGAKLTLTGLRLSLAVGEARAICQYQDLYYLATAGGLLAFDQNGQLRAHYTILDGLPSLDLLTLASYRNRLYIGSADGGLIAFDGHDFTLYQFQKPAARQIDALLVENDQLLVGSFDAGLFSFDGATFTRRDNNGTPLPQITALLSQANRLYVGTYAAGLFLYQEGRWQHLTKADGLPSDHITTILGDPGGPLIATDFGVVRATSENQFQTLSTVPNIVSLTRWQNDILAGLFTGGFITITNRPANVNSMAGLNGVVADQDEWHKRGSTRLWTAEDGSIFALTQNGLWRAAGDRTQLDFQQFGSASANAPLSASHISTLAFDQRGRLWVGYFDHGIDIFEPESMELISHLEDQSIREVNFIRADPEQSRMLVATAAGLAIIDPQLHYRLLDEKAGLSSNAVAHVSIVTKNGNQQLVLATGRGLTMLDGAIARTPISLPNNYLYTSTTLGDRLFIGSLGGLIEIEGLRAVRTLNISNSKLSHNWINALVAVNGTLYIGTNGGGVDALLPSGELVSYASQIGKFDVNPNAMLADGNRLLVGSLGNGLFIFDLAGRNWKHATRGLPSNNVTAMISNDRYLYFATANGLARFERQQFNF